MVGQVLMLVEVPMLAFTRRFRDDHRRGWWMKMMGRSLTASNT
jgi:hypothetical protein